ncbi:hypothetical protein ACF0H5_001529 [Mactra antiquata]
MTTLFIIAIYLITGATIASGVQRSDMSNIIETLKKLDQLRQSHDVALHPLGTLNDDKPSFNLISDYGPSLYHDSADLDSEFTSKSKRGWEDFSPEWRQAPKRAWDVVRTLWKRPDIRTKYMSYLKNGKRNGEVLEKTPVQKNDADPSLTWNDIGYDATSNPGSSSKSIGFDSDIFDPLEPATKRGWEDIGIFKVKGGKRRVLGLNEALITKNDYNKRG